MPTAFQARLAGPTYRSKVQSIARIVVACCGLVTASRLAADWTIDRRESLMDLPGRAVVVSENGQMLARFVYGEGQEKPYLALFDEDGQQLTNPGIDAAGNPVAPEPHQRGIYIGWQKVRSDLGVTNLWAIRDGTRMQVTGFGPDKIAAKGATLVAHIEWRAGKADVSGSDLLVREARRLEISRPVSGRGVQVYASFELKAARDLFLDGDVQHAGIHMRVAPEVTLQHVKETSYLWSPDVPAAPGKVVGERLQWGEFLFPLKGRWYRALQMNAPSNPVEEFSMREYGRFGFFFRRELKKNQTLVLHYGFVVMPTETPTQAPVRTGGEIVSRRASDAPINVGAPPPVRLSPESARARAEAEAAYARYVRTLPR